MGNIGLTLWCLSVQETFVQSFVDSFPGPNRMHWSLGKEGFCAQTMKGELVMTCRQLQSKAPLKSQSLRPNLQSLDVKQLSDIQQMYGKVPPQIHLEGTKGYCRPHWTKSFPSHKRKKRTSVHVASKLVTCLRQTSRNPTWWFSAFLKLCGIQSSNVSEADEPSTFNQISQKQESCKVRFRGKTPPAEIGRKWSGSLELPRNQQRDVGILGCESHETNQRINVQTKCKANKRKARRRSSGRGMQSAMANGERWRVRFVEISWNMGLWYALMCFWSRGLCQSKSGRLNQCR